jgi:hypothetical protein
VTGKSRFVLPDRSKPLQTPATLQETEKTEEKVYIFVPEAAGKPSGIIPENGLDRNFVGEPES